MKSEQAVEKYLCRQVHDRGGMCVKLNCYNGIPDRLVILPPGKDGKDGKCVFVELKADGGRVAPIQCAVHAKLRRMGQLVFILWDFSMVDSFINYFFGGR